MRSKTAGRVVNRVEDIRGGAFAAQLAVNAPEKLRITLAVAGFTREQLDVSLADVEQDRLDSLRFDGFAVNELHLEIPLIKLDGGVEILNSHTDVIYASEHEATSLAMRPIPPSGRGRISSGHGAESRRID